MGEFQRNTVESPHKSEVRLSGGFATNGGSDPTTIYGNWILSVARTGAGAYTVTLKKPFRNLKVHGKSASLQLGTAGDSKVVLGPYDYAAGTQVVTTITTAAAADIAADANNIVWLELVCSYTNLGDGATRDT